MITKSGNSIYVSFWLGRLLFVIVTIHWALTKVIPRHVIRASKQFFQPLNHFRWSCFIELRWFFYWAELKVWTNFLSQANFMQKVMKNKRITTTVFLVLLWKHAYQDGRTPLSDQNVAKNRFITPKILKPTTWFFFSVVDNLITFCYKKRKKAPALIYVL